MVALVTRPVVRGLRWVAGMLAVLTVGLVFAGLNLTTTAADLLFLATLAAVALGIPALTMFFFAIWLEDQAEGSDRLPVEPIDTGSEAGRMPFAEPLKCYGIALVCVAIAWGIRHAIDPYLLAYVPFPTFFLAVAITGWLGGFGPAVLAILLSTGLARYFYMSPLHELTVDNVLTAVSICTFVVVSLLLAAMTATLHAALRRIQQLTAAAKVGEGQR